MKPLVTIVDYGVGNIFSVTRAFEHCGAQVILATTAEQIAVADRLVLPGVGAFEDGMKGLRDLRLVAPLQSYATTGRPVLGICLGMQMLFESGEEFGAHEGLGLIPGSVVAIPNTGTDGRPHKIPHIGWAELLAPSGQAWSGTVLEGLPPGASAYFVHSFHAVPARAESRLADCDYDGRAICAAVQLGSVFGCQFHPEKSGSVGLLCIANFLKVHY